MANTTTHVIRGRLDWAKVIGDPRMNKFTEEREWSVDVTPDKNGLAEIKKIGISGKLKTPKEGDARKAQFLTLRQKEYRTDPKTGQPIKNDPIPVKDIEGNDWGKTLIGNGTIADVKFTVKDYGPGKQKGVYIKAIRVLKLIPYETEEFAPLSSDDEFFAVAAGDDESPAPESNDDGGDLEDDIPFDEGN